MLLAIPNADKTCSLNSQLKGGWKSNFIPTLYPADTKTKPRPVLTRQFVKIALNLTARAPRFPAGRLGITQRKVSLQKPVPGQFGKEKRTRVHQRRRRQHSGERYTLCIQGWTVFIKSSSKTLPPYLQQQKSRVAWD